VQNNLVYVWAVLSAAKNMHMTMYENATGMLQSTRAPGEPSPPPQPIAPPSLQSTRHRHRERERERERKKERCLSSRISLLTTNQATPMDRSLTVLCIVPYRHHAFSTCMYPVPFSLCRTVQQQQLLGRPGTCCQVLGWMWMLLSESVLCRLSAPTVRHIVTGDVNMRCRIVFASVGLRACPQPLAQERCGLATGDVERRCLQSSRPCKTARQ